MTSVASRMIRFMRRDNTRDRRGYRRAAAFRAAEAADSHALRTTSNARTAKRCWSPGSRNSARQTTQAVPDIGSRIWAGCHSPSSARTSTLRIARAPAYAKPPTSTTSPRRTTASTAAVVRHVALPVPPARDPEPWLPVVDGVDRDHPLRLLHPVEIGHVEPQRKPVFGGQRHAVPVVRQHGARIRSNRVERDHFVKSVRRRDLEMRRRWLERQRRQQLLQADAAPACRADQISADGIRDARQRDELVRGRQRADARPASRTAVDRRGRRRRDASDRRRAEALAYRCRCGSGLRAA